MKLTLKSARPTSLLLTGTTTPIAALPVARRAAVLRGWSASRLPMLRVLARQLTMLFKQPWLRSSPSLPLVLGFPRAPVHGVPGEGFPFAFLQIPPANSDPSSSSSSSASLKAQKGKADKEEPFVLETDVVIVGSGCGAGVAAKNLSEAGHRVIVAEKSYYWPPEHLPMSQGEGPDQLFMSGGSIVSDDASIVVVAGQTWGGGGTVNWSASLQTQGFVRREWAAAPHNLPFFTSPAFQRSLDRVCARMGVSAEHVDHNPANAALMEGARRLGWTHKPVPQNTGGKQHYCGYCSFGCGACEKQGPVVSFLPDAARAGATFIEGLDVTRVLFDEKSRPGGAKVAVGVEGIWTSRDPHGGVSGPGRYTRRVIISSKRVILSAGSLSTPLVLLRSGLTNPNIGAHLRLHPVSVVGATFPERTRPWEGGILTSVVSEFENLDGAGHGVKLETTVMLPAFFLPWLPWADGASYKARAAKMASMAGLIVLARDADDSPTSSRRNRVYPDPADGRARIAFTPSRKDRAHLARGIRECARALYAAGATEIFTTVPGAQPYAKDAAERAADDDAAAGADAGPGDGVNNPRFAAWLASLPEGTLPAPETLLVSAHQMGSCRMGASPKNSAVDPEGRVWGAEGVFVCDASAMPGASGVNPMVTGMALADWVSGGVARGLGRGGKL